MLLAFYASDGLELLCQQTNKLDMCGDMRFHVVWSIYQLSMVHLANIKSNLEKKIKTLIKISIISLNIQCMQAANKRSGDNKRSAPCLV